MQLRQTTWKTQINILCIGQAILMIVLAMSLPYWPLYVAQLGQFSAIEIRYWSAAIYAAPFLSSIFFSPIWGKFADNHGHKSMIIRACIGLIITQALILFVDSVFWIFIIRLLQGALAGFIAAAQSWAVSLSPTEARGSVIGKLQSSVAVGNLCGPFLGGIIATYVGYRAIFSVSTVICFVMLCVFYFVLHDSYTPQASKPIKQTKNFQSLSLLQKNVMYLLSVIILTQAAQSMVTPIFSLFVTEKLAGTEMTIGILYAASGLMMLISAPIIGKFLDKLENKEKKIPTFLIVLLIAGGCVQMLNACSTSIISIFILRLLWGICLGGILPILTRIIVDNVHDYNRGLALGFGNSANRFGTLAGVLIGAIIEAQFGYTTSFLLNGSLYFISAILIFIHIKSLYMSYERYSFER